MHLKKLILVNFKNYTEAELEFCSGINCFTGVNGEGKTNLLDAIHYLSMCKSFFNPIDSQNILYDAPFFIIQGQFENAEHTDDIFCGLKRNQKKQFKRNKLEYERLADHIGTYPLVMISPADTDLINEGSESRRRFIDSVISQFDRIYLDDVMNYNKIVSQRNALLKRFAETKRFQRESLEVWDFQLLEFGFRIFEKRMQLIEEVVPLFQKYYQLISGAKEKVAIHYHSHHREADPENMLSSALARDRAVQYTTRGIHKDDLEFLINDHPIRKFGSQGQQKSYLIALKLAQFEYMQSVKQQTPLLLLDDIHDKLDEKRVEHLMQIVSGANFGQIFITDTHKDRLATIFVNKPSIPFKQFEITSGKFHEQQ